MRMQGPPRLDYILPSSGLFATDVAGLPICPIFNYQAVEEKTAWPLKMTPIGSPETSDSHQLTPHNNPEDERILPIKSLLCVVLINLVWKDQ
jgi:hypothetical protein